MATRRTVTWDPERNRLEYHDQRGAHRISATISGGGGGGSGAPVGAEYVVVSLDGTLTDERNLAVGTGLSLTDGGANGPITIAPALDLAAVEGLSSTGLATRTAASTWTTRTITAGVGISVADGDGVAGNPVVSTSIAPPTMTVYSAMGASWQTHTFPATHTCWTFNCVGGGASGAGGETAADGTARNGGGGGGSGGRVDGSGPIVCSPVYILVGVGGASVAAGGTGQPGGFTYISTVNTSTSSNDIIVVSQAAGPNGGAAAGGGGAGGTVFGGSARFANIAYVAKNGQNGSAGSGGTAAGIDVAPDTHNVTGGAGGGGRSTGNADFAGGGITASSTLAAVAAGTAGGGNGGPGVTSTNPRRSTGGAGGGGGTTGGIGGTGGLGSGGGGGGGGVTGGASGAGGDGYVVIVSW